jgi:hypothetical protein
MFLRCHSRKKNGKPHRYCSVVESLRIAGGHPGLPPRILQGKVEVPG